MISNSIAILFPSTYEGLGLPIFNGVDYNKKVIVKNNELNKELKNYLRNFSDNILLFNNEKDLENILEQVYIDSIVVYNNGKQNTRTWNDVAIELDDFLESINNANINIQLLRERWKEMKYLENVHRCYVSDTNCYDYSKISLKIVLKETIKNKYPMLFKQLKAIKQMKNR